MDVKSMPVPGGYRLASVGGVHLELLVMARPRVVEKRASNDLVYDRFWCYDTMEAAVLAVAAWDGDAAGEPAGYRSRGGPSMRPTPAPSR